LTVLCNYLTLKADYCLITFKHSGVDTVGPKARSGLSCHITQPQTRWKQG